MVAVLSFFLIYPLVLIALAASAGSTLIVLSALAAVPENDA